MTSELNRRDFLRLGMAAGVTSALSLGLPKFSMAQVKTCTLNQVLDMTPEEIASSSRLVTASQDLIQKLIREIQNTDTRAIVQAIVDNPAPTLMTKLMGSQNLTPVYKELSAKGLAADRTAANLFPETADPQNAPHPFMAGPGGGYQSHHAYPGGLPVHTALNTLLALDIYDRYVEIYGYKLDRDAVIASQLLHDLHKPWVFQWQADGASRTELKLAGTGEHHVLGVAESIVRGLPAEICVAQACAHNHPGFEPDEKKVVDWITAAAIVAGKDPVKAGLLEKGGNTLPLPRRMEGFVCHVADHDWVLTVPAAKWLFPEIQKIARKEYGMTEKDLAGKKYNQFRNYLFAQASLMGLYETYSTRGKHALTHTVLSIVAPA